MGKPHILNHDREMINDKALNALIGVTFFILATALGAYVRIPIKGSPVPITLQTFFVMLSGAVLGRRLGSFTQFGYIMLGVLGLPVFQGCSLGISYIFGPTGGYLLGFILAAYYIGRMLTPKDFSVERAMASFIIGDAIIHMSGTMWLIYPYGMNATDAVSIGILPFIPGEIVKLFFAIAIYSKIYKRSKAIFSV